MAWLLDPLEDRIEAILEDGRGLDGTLGAFVASYRAIPRKAYRRSADSMPLADPAYPGERFDMAYHLQYDSLGFHAPEIAENPLDAAHLRAVALTLQIGHAYGVDLARFVALYPGSQEDRTVSVINPRKRALATAERAVRALTYPDLFRDTTTDPQLVDCRRVGPTTLTDLGGGRLISETPLLVWIQTSATSTYVP